MEELDLKELFEFVKEKIGLLIIITFAVCLAGSLYSIFMQKPMYKSYTTIVLGSNGSSASSTITQTDITINKNLVDTYAEIVKSRKVVEQAISKLGLETTYESINGMISVSSVNNTEIIKITVSNRNAVDAKNISNVVAEYFIDEVKNIYKLDNANVLDEARISETPYNINTGKQIIIFFGAGLILGAAILFLIFYFDRSVKSVEQVEEKIKLPILGSVQLYNKGGKKK